MAEVIDPLEAAKSRIAEQTESPVDLAKARLAEIQRNTLDLAKARQKAIPDLPQGWEVVDQTPDGGYIMTDDRGGLHFKNDAYSTSEEADILSIMSGTPTSSVARSRADKTTIGQRPYSALGATALKGVPFAGEWIDEAIGTASPKAGEAMRGLSAAYEREKPLSALGAKVGVGISSAIPFAVGSSVPATGSGIARLAKAVAVGFGLGSSEGAISGAGAADPGQRVEGAKSGAFYGGIAGAFFGGASVPTAAAFRNVAQYAGQKSIRDAARKLGVSQDAIKALRWAIKNDGGIDAVYDRLVREYKIGDDITIPGLGPQGNLASASGPATKLLVDSAATTFGPGMKVVQDATEKQIGAAFKTVKNSLRSVLGRSKTADILRRREESIALGKKISSVYEIAYKGPDSIIDPLSDKGGNVIRELSRINPEKLKSAVRLAEEAMRLDGINFVPLKISKKGRIDGELTIKHLDQLKRSFEEIAYSPANYDVMTGRFTPEGRIAAQSAKVVRDAAKSHSARYTTALELAASRKGAEVADDFGFHMMEQTWRPENVHRKIGEMDGAELAHAKAGLMRWVEKKLGNVGATISTASTPDDVKQLNVLFREMTKPESIEKMAALVGDLDAAEIGKSIRRAGIVANLRAQVAMGSKTLPRKGVADFVDDLTGPGILGKAMEGSPTEATKEMIQIMTGRTKEMSDARLQGFFADIAELAVQRTDMNAEIVLRILDGIDIREPIGLGKARIIADFVMSSAAFGGYEAATESQPRDLTRAQKEAELYKWKFGND